MFCFKKQDLLLKQLHVLVALQTVSARVGHSVWKAVPPSVGRMKSDLQEEHRNLGYYLFCFSQQQKSVFRRQDLRPRT